jgi:hypothetical protein
LAEAARLRGYRRTMGNHAYDAAYALNYLDEDGHQLTADQTYPPTLDPPPPAAVVG